MINLAKFSRLIPERKTIEVGGKIRELMDDLALQGGMRPNVQVACSSSLQAEQLVDSHWFAAALHELAKESLRPYRPPWLPIPYHYSLCLAWSTRTTGTRPGLIRLIGQLGINAFLSNRHWSVLPVLGGVALLQPRVEMRVEFEFVRFGESPRQFFVVTR